MEHQNSQAARRPQRAEWTSLRPRLTDWYITDNRTARQIKDLLRKEGFDVSVKILRDRFSEWSLRKNNSSNGCSPQSYLITPSPLSERSSNVNAASPDSSAFAGSKRKRDGHQRPVKRVCTRDDSAKELEYSVPPCFADKLAAMPAKHEVPPASLFHSRDNDDDDTSSTMSSSATSPELLTRSPLVELDQRGDLPDVRSDHIKAILERRAIQPGLYPSLESQEILENLTLDLIRKWCRKFRKSNASIGSEHLTCKVYKLLDDCKIAVGGACGYNTKAFWDKLLDVDARASRSWDIKRPESFLLALCGLLRLLERVQERKEIVKIIIDVLAISSLRHLGESHPMALLFRMASWNSISLRFCSKVRDVLETEYISQTRGDKYVLRARLLRCFGNVLINLKKFDEAESYYTQAFECAKAGSDINAVVEAYCGLARMERYRGRPDAAQKSLQSALEHLRDAGKNRSSLAANVLFKSAYAYMLMDDAAASELQFRQALSIYEQKGYALISRSDLIVVVRNLDDVLYRQGKATESQDLRRTYPDAFEQREELVWR